MTISLFLIPVALHFMKRGRLIHKYEMNINNYNDNDNLFKSATINK